MFFDTSKSKIGRQRLENRLDKLDYSWNNGLNDDQIRILLKKTFLVKLQDSFISISFWLLLIVINQINILNVVALLEYWKVNTCHFDFVLQQWVLNKSSSILYSLYNSSKINNVRHNFFQTWESFLCIFWQPGVKNCLKVPWFEPKIFQYLITRRQWLIKKI